MSDHHQDELSFPDRQWQPFVIGLGVIGVALLIFYHPIVW